MANRKISDDLKARLVIAVTSEDKAAELADLIEEMVAAFNAMAAKLDADAGVTDTDFEATLAIEK